MSPVGLHSQEQKMCPKFYFPAEVPVSIFQFLSAEGGGEVGNEGHFATQYSQEGG